MVYNKIYGQNGLQKMPNWRQFVIDAAAKNIPVYGVSVDDMGVIVDVQENGAAGSRCNFRPTKEIPAADMMLIDSNWKLEYGDYSLDNPAYNIRGDNGELLTNEEVHDMYKRSAYNHVEATFFVMPPELDRSITSIGTWNEPRNPDENSDEPPPAGFTDWFDAQGWQAYYIGKELVSRKESGKPWFRWAAFAFAGGNPDEGAWESEGMLKYLKLAAQYPDVLGVALHEYSFTMDIWRGFDQRDYIGRFEKLFAVCDKHGIKRPWIEIKEWGWEEADIPDRSQAMQDIAEVAEYYAQFPEIIMAAIWTARKWHGSANIHEKVQALAPDLYEFALTTTFPDPTSNLLLNGDFSSRNWSTLANGNQSPEHWQIWWAEPENNPSVDRVPEMVHKLNSQLPPNEQIGGDDALILAGDAVYKSFTVHGRTRFSISQTITGLQKDQWVRVVGHILVDYQNEVNEEDDVGVAVHAGNGVTIYNALDFPHKEWVVLAATGQANASGELLVSVDASNNYANSRGWFFDAFSAITYEVDPPIEPPDPEESFAEWVWRMAEGEQVLSLNKDAGLQKAMVGIDRQGPVANEKWFTYSDGTKWAIQMAGSWDSDIGRAYYAPVDNFNDIGFVTEYQAPIEPPEPEFAYTHWPTEYKSINQPFGANPDYYGQFGLPGHEGVDIRAPHGSDIYAPADGVVSDVHESDGGHAYGIFVRIRHGDTGYESTLAHHLTNLVKKGDVVKGGQIIALADSTGNSSGSHCHITLKHDDAYEGGEKYIGYPHRIVDPTEFLEPLMGAPIEPPKPTVDMAPYFSPPSGRSKGDIFILSNNWGGGDERVQLQSDNGKVFVTKNQQWEQRRVDSSRIYLELDTSPGNGEYYTVKSNTGWMPRYWSVGGRFRRAEDVMYFGKGNCQLKRAARFETDLVFTAHHGQWTSKAGVTFADVIELAWEVDGASGTYIDERYWFAAGYGLVGWLKYDGKESWVSEITQGQGDNEREIIPCL